MCLCNPLIIYLHSYTVYCLSVRNKVVIERESLESKVSKVSVPVTFLGDSLAQQVVPMSYKLNGTAFNDLNLNIGFRMWRFGVLL